MCPKTIKDVDIILCKYCSSVYTCQEYYDKIGDDTDGRSI